MKHLKTIVALAVALMLAGCAAPAAQPEPAVPAVETPAPAAEPTPAPTLQPVTDLTTTPDYSVKFLGKDTAAADAAGGIGEAKAEEMAAAFYGDLLADRPQTYTCEGLAEYMGKTYYAISWTQLMEDDGKTEDFYMGHFYVALDGSEVLEGDQDSVYPPLPDPC